MLFKLQEEGSLSGVRAHPTLRGVGWITKTLPLVS